VVGVNEYVDADEERQVDILEIPHEVELTQVDRLTAFKDRRDDDGVRRALDEIREAAKRNDNVMPALVDGALADCTLGEMVQALADVYGRYAGGPEW
jgi:methylmalonyl-CoA mutase N-terminal domain/subunit